MRAESTSLTHANSARGEWAQYLAFLKRPKLPPMASGIGTGNLMAVLRMLALDIGIMLVLVSIAIAVMAIGFELPETALAKLEITPGLLALIVIGAPIGEEIVFRSWLSGRPGHVLAAIISVVGGLVLAVVGAEASSKSLGPIVLVVTLIAAILAIVLLRKRPAMRWFAWAFPFFFYASTIGFSLMHLANFEAGDMHVLLPLVLPQLILGSMLGYLRVNYGLWANILLHALHNSLAIGVVLLATHLSVAA